MAEKFCLKWRLPRQFLVLLHAVKHDMGQTALLPLRRKAWIFRPKNPTASAGFEHANSGTKGQRATSRPPKPPGYEIMCKNIVEPDRPQMTVWRMRIACWLPKATDTQSEHVIVIAFPP
jgi:hypothetical protein